MSAEDALARRPQRRNLLVVLYDDLRFDTPTYAGGEARTPNMDRLARTGTIFRFAVTTVGLCSPARATLFTGRYGHQTGLDDNILVWHSRLLRLPRTEKTLLEWCHEAGYFVGYFGKWHLEPEGPMARGIDRPKPWRLKKRPIDIRKPPQFETIRRYYEPGKTFEEKPEYYGTRPGTFQDTREYRYTQQALKFLDEAGELQRPFALFVSYHAPHPPYVVPAPYDTMYSPQSVRLPDNFLHRSDKKPRYQNDPLWYWHDVGHLSQLDWRRMRSHYYGFVTMADVALGLLLQRLEQLGLDNNTMIVLAGDQGSMLGEHALYDKGPYSYDELMRIPLIVRVPGTQPRTVDRHVSLIDVHQTVVEWLGLRPDPKPRFSRSLLPLVRGEPNAWKDVPDAAFYRYEWYNGGWWGIRAVRTHQWKYCWNPAGIDELYDLQDDPGEMENRIDDPAARPHLERLQKMLLEHLTETADPILDRYREQTGL